MPNMNEEQFYDHKIVLPICDFFGCWPTQIIAEFSQGLAVKDDFPFKKRTIFRVKLCEFPGEAKPFPP